jgi:large subunit ribosomal protein L24
MACTEEADSKKKAPSMKVKKGDTVVVLAGKDKGARGRVIAAYPQLQKVLVEGVGRSRSTPASARTSAAPSRAGSSPRRPPST